MTQNKRILLATGGTGGHVFPAIALGSFLHSKGYDVEFSTDARGKKYFAQYSFPVHTISCASPSGKALKKAIAMLRLGIGFIQSLLFIRKFDAVIGFGGYASFPPIVAAKIFRKKIILHEQNAVLGKVNRVLQKHADHTATSFPITKFAGEQAKYVGSFVRNEFTSSPLPEVGKKINLLVIGGSQGAKIFSDIFPSTLTDLDLKVTHQVPKSELEETKEAYAEMGIEAELAPFFTDIKQRIESAHLVVSRAGASSILELITIGRPTIFIPLRDSADNHQFENAQNLAQNNAAWLVEENGVTQLKITKLLRELCADPSKLAEKAKMMHNQSQPNSKQRMLELIESK